MSLKSPSLPIRNNRFGFHYFEDSEHYRDYDLAIWLPVLQSLGSSWTLLQAPSSRAIPESFITGLVQGSVEPVLHFPSSIGNLPSPSDLAPLLSSYQRWGCHLVVFFDRVNSHASWPVAGWTHEDLVDRFLDHFLPYAAIALQNGLIPVLPPLQPGGDYWDTAFLRSTLEALERRKQTQLLESLVLSAYGWTHAHDFNWGIGGPERWPEARPYFTPDGTQDHLGLRISDWYQAVASAVLQKNCPLILLQLGQAEDPHKNQAADVEQQTKTNLALGHLLNGEEFNGYEPLSSSILAGMFWKLAPSGKDPEGNTWFEEDGTPAGFVPDWQTWVKGLDTTSSQAKSFQVTGGTSRPLTHYLLLPHPDAGLFEWQWDALRPFVRKEAPTIGFSILEAALANRVTVLGGEDEFPEEILNQLRSNGCWVERISGSGTDVATYLAER